MGDFGGFLGPKTASLPAASILPQIPDFSVIYCALSLLYFSTFCPNFGVPVFAGDFPVFWKIVHEAGP
jgi:hypothetical protein